MPEEFENGGQVYSENTSKVFRPHYFGGIWKRRSSLFWKHIKSFPSTLRRRNLKTEVKFILKTHQKFSVHTTSEEFEDVGQVYSENASKVFRPHYFGGIWKRRSSLFWKRIKSFPSTLRRKNLKTQHSPVILHSCLSKIQRSVPVGPRRICDGSPTYSNLHEMQIELRKFQPFYP